MFEFLIKKKEENNEGKTSQKHVPSISIKKFYRTKRHEYIVNEFCKLFMIKDVIDKKFILND